MRRTARVACSCVLLWAIAVTAASAAEDAALAERHRQWLEEVALIITPDERAAFLALDDEYRRDAFVEEFWKARDPDPATPLNTFRDTYYARRDEAVERFGAVDVDAARVWILNGEPADVAYVECGLAVWPVQIWYYRSSDRIPGAFTLLFYRPSGGKLLRLWHPSEGFRPLQALPTVDQKLDAFEPDNADQALPGDSFWEFARYLQNYCVNGDDLPRLIAAIRDLKGNGRGTLTAAQTPPPIDPEWLATFGGTSTDLPEGAADPLSDEHRRWLDEVALLITPDERRTFLGLPRGHQRAGFIEAFWQTRDPNPKTPGNEFRSLFEARRATALERWKSTTDDMPRVYILNGEPAAVVETDCNQNLWPLQIWQYAYSDRSRRGFHLVFRQPPPGVGPYRLWHSTEGIDELQRTPTADQMADASRQDNTGRGPGRRTGAFIDRLRYWCPAEADAIVEAVLRLQNDDFLLAEIADQPPPVDPEWLATYRAFSTELPASSTELPAVLEVDFPDRLQSRTVVRGTLLVAAAAPDAQGEPAPRAFALNGEVLREGALHESFRYHFQLPAGSAGPDGSLPLVFERALRPGEYRLIVKLEDTRDGRAVRLERALSVPAAPTPAGERPAPSAASVAAALAATGAGEALTALRLLAPASDLLTGVVRVEAEVTDPRVATVTFALDGKPLLTRQRPPWTVELRLGDLPRSVRVRAVAKDAEGAVMAVDERLLNPAPHRFTVRVVEPREAAGPGPLRVRVAVDTPEERAVDRVELFLDDAQVATLFQPPWEAVLPRGPAAATFVRAVAYLADGTAAEDAVVLGGPEGQRGEVDVELVEVYATVLGSGGHPVDELAATDFTVREDGRPQQLQRFQHVTELPLHVGMLVDTSASMAEALPRVETAALAFFDGALAPGDRAAVMTFAEEPRLAAPFTDDLQRLSVALVGLRAERGTALWDSVLFALHYFQGVPGRRALLLFSDGADRGSRFTFDQALAFAQHAGVAVYAVSFGGPSDLLEGRRRITRLAEATGGRSFALASVDELPATYEEIERELRSQYLLVYQSDGSGPGFRAVDVEVKRPGLEVRTMRGYIP